MKSENEAIQHYYAFCRFILEVDPETISSHEDLNEKFFAVTGVPLDESKALLKVGQGVLLKTGDATGLLESARKRCTEMWGYHAHRLPSKRKDVYPPEQKKPSP